MPRFKIRRHKLTYPTRNPWILADDQRPYYLGHFPTLAAALVAADNAVRRELGMPARLRLTAAEVRDEMIRRWRPDDISSVVSERLEA